jgi:hypothetical protein
MQKFNRNMVETETKCLTLLYMTAHFFILVQALQYKVVGLNWITIIESFTTPSHVLANKKNILEKALFLYFVADCATLGCEQICIDKPVFDPVCLCGEGYELNSDKKTCKGIYILSLHISCSILYR